MDIMNDHSKLSVSLCEAHLFVCCHGHDTGSFDNMHKMHLNGLALT